ncbi:MAG TPA: hypothetical protein VMB34_19145 [Acetobacteraceae bacterium]|nr:hypothetical protein [Acetobacteraceae bacterium]
MEEGKLRRMSFGIGGTARLSPLAENRLGAAAEPPYHAQNWLRRRLEDAVEDVFRAALQRGDLASAEDLLGVLENMHARARLRFKSERKGTVAMIERARKELEARKTRRRL